MNLNEILERDLGYPHIQGPLLPAGRLEKVRLPTTEDDICNKDRDGIPRRNTSALFPDLWVHPTPIPPLMTYVSLFMFSHFRKRSYCGSRQKKTNLLVVLRSRFVLRSGIHLSSHYCGVLHDFPSSPRSFCLLLLLSREVPHIRPRGLLRARHLFLISQIHGHHWPRPTRYLDRHQSTLIRNETLRHLRGPIHWRNPP